MLNKFFIAAGLLWPFTAIPVSMAGEPGYHGLKPINDKEKQFLHAHKAQSIGVTSLGLERINLHRRLKGEPDLNEDVIWLPEFSASAPISTSEVVGTSLPAQVDNSSSTKFFPPIGSQGAENSCVGWATTYYMMSHEVCLATAGCDNQTPGAGTSRIFSPRWTYNQINGGVDNGSYFSSAFSLVKDHGAATLSQLPYQAGDFRRWDLNPQDWRAALWSRMGSVQSININTDSGIQLVKQSLVNGHVMVLGTYIDSWQLGAVQSVPGAAASPFVGQKIVYYQNGTLGAHAMTVVGYDDGVWADSNGNGIAEIQEIGAFKIANSWGAGYGNNGFLWASYDAFRTSSTVPGFAPANRNELTQTGYVYLTPYTTYAPKLLARARLSHKMRGQMSYRIGSSLNTASTPTSSITFSGMQNAGGAYAFDGSTTEVAGTFYFDISSLLTSSWNQQRFYLTAADNTLVNPLTVERFEVVDPATDAVLLSAAGVPATVDMASKTFIAGDQFADTQPPTAPTNLAATLKTTKPRRVTLTWKAATDNVAIKNYLVYRNGVLIATLGASSLSYADGSSFTVGVIYSYTVKATDTSNNVSPASTAISVKF
jgi:C1A family cysteine protease